MEVGEGQGQLDQLSVLGQDLKKVFGQYLPEGVRMRPALRVLGVQCGFAPDAIAITQLYPNATYLGVDDDPNINLVAKIVGVDVPDQRATFQEGDLKNRETFGDRSWDLIIIRTPDLVIPAQRSGINEDWQKILLNCAQSLDVGGLVIVTSQDTSGVNAVGHFLEEQMLSTEVPVTNISEDMHSNYPGRENYLTILQKRG